MLSIIHEKMCIRATSYYCVTIRSAKLTSWINTHLKQWYGGWGGRGGVGGGGVTTRPHALTRESGGHSLSHTRQRASVTLLCWRGSGVTLSHWHARSSLSNFYMCFPILGLYLWDTPILMRNSIFLNSKQPDIKCVLSYQLDIKVIHTQ